MELVEKLEKLNPEPKPLASVAINGEWTLRWTTSESILGRKRMRGFRVDLDRLFTQPGCIHTHTHAHTYADDFESVFV
jgi:hypothetical protein